MDRFRTLSTDVPILVLVAIDARYGILVKTGALSLTSLTVTLTVTSLDRGPCGLESLALTWKTYMSFRSRSTDLHHPDG